MRNRALTGVGIATEANETTIKQSFVCNPTQQWKRIVIWALAVLDLVALAIVLWAW
jgi:hypothetical protein